MNHSKYIITQPLLPDWQLELVLKQMDELTGKPDRASKELLAQLTELVDGLEPLPEPLIEGWRI